MLNIFQLNYDNYLKLDAVDHLTKQKVKDAADSSVLDGVITSDMKMYASDIMFKKK